jgi:hypothetical protein
MSISPRQFAGKSLRSERPHDPTLCGLSQELSCAACRATCWPPRTPLAHLAMWMSLCEQHRLLARACGWPNREPAPPDPMPAEELSRLLWSFLTPAHRQIVVDVLLELLTDGVADIALAVAQEVRR